MTTTLAAGQIGTGRNARWALAALGIGAFGIGLTEFVIMGLLVEVAQSLSVSVPSAGLLISGYALGVTFGGPLLTLATARLPHRNVILSLMAIFILANILCAVAPSYGLLMLGRVISGFAHGTFFGVGTVVAQSLVPPERKASAIALVFTGLTLATVLGLPFGTELGQALGWRATFWSVSGIGLLALVASALSLPAGTRSETPANWRSLARLLRGAPLLALATTTLGYAGVFLVFTYIAPILTGISGVSSAHVSRYLLLFGAGIVVGNILGGRLADRGLRPALVGTLAGLAAVILAMRLGMGNPFAAAISLFLFGVAAFSTLAPLQSFMLSRSEGASAELASTLNISAFNLANAIGAAIGGSAIAAGWGLGSLFPLGAVMPVLAVLLTLATFRSRERS
ncbi:MFS transporter [Paracoccus onubensis]|uniref:MFS transporter n=1 Tax=Paracoccus onubensis TaxID=1675788 RepID=UPI0027304618|nr:MFS transporter [Paracoccus onubensis]MDP0926940.1 MFS transporter [Paracoccus onubensis]